jgi:hypothetical protein
MTEPKHAQNTRGGKRFYTWGDTNFWSVTTILSGGVPKPALVPWGIKSTAEGAVTHFDVLTTMLSHCENRR